MLQRPCLLSMIMAALCTSAALPDEYEARPNEVPGWGRVIDPWRDCDVSLDRENERLKIQVPGTPHVLSAEVDRLPIDRKSTRLNSSHVVTSRMPSSA